MNVLPASLLLWGLIGAAGHAQAANNCTIVALAVIGAAWLLRSEG